ncbi:MAG: hypothetical protein ABIA59_07535, partial [Candidatus Latescibacterota bacterium]
GLSLSEALPCQGCGELPVYHQDGREIRGRRHALCRLLRADGLVSAGSYVLPGFIASLPANAF